ncbi:hypothetical protein F4678DRAFT_478631 [Xylaria arbuscula]|nr:hypothetical protein F4678DRAFT_478631 [Xylaria arbuscula]
MATYETYADGVIKAVNFVESQFSNTSAPLLNHDNLEQQLPPGIPKNDGYHKSLIEGAPPGLVRVCPPRLAQTRLFDNSNTTLFSDFEAYLDGGLDEDGNHVLVDLTCMICCENKLQVPHRVMPASSGSDDADGKTESISVLPCGHFFGTKCLQKWLVVAERQDENGVAHCPVCRFSMIYQCGHILFPQRYDPDYRRRARVALTIPEDGLVPEMCRSCHEGEIDDALDRLQRLLFPLAREYGDLRFEDSEQGLLESSMLLDEQAWHCWGMNIHYNRW